MSGAGMSVSAGIPDYRSPGTGLYEEIKRVYNLEDPQVIFSKDFFIQNPEPFYKYSQEFDNEIYKPTPTHYFVRLLQEKNLLLMHFTQNVDGLELKAGISEEKLVQAHGSYATSHCMQCNQEYSKEVMDEHLRKQIVLRCSSCNGLVKPDVVLFGEKLPQKYIKNMSKCLECDLLLVIGTSLFVFPFAGLKDLVPIHTPKILINKQKLPGFEFYNSLQLNENCDDIVNKICEDLGWSQDLKNLMQA